MFYLKLFLIYLISFSCFAKVLTFAVIGDAGYKNRHSEKVRYSIKKSKIKKLILPGDNLYDLNFTYDEVWGDWLGDDFDFSVVALGNHYLSFEEEMNFFDMPGEYFKKKINGVNFIVLNSENRLNVEEQSNFLKDELDKISEKEQTFIVFHHPPATISYRHGWEERKEFHEELRKTLTTNHHKIDAILVGHDHQASLFLYGKIPVIVSGAIFEYFPARRVNTTINNLRVKTVWAFDSGYFWTRLDIDTKKKVTWINFIDAYKDKVMCSIRVSKKSRMIIRNNCKRN